jgi:hypothetical protein
MTSFTTTRSASRSGQGQTAARTQAAGAIRTLGAGIATMALAGSLAGPAAAREFIPVAIQPDLRLESFTVTDMGQDYGGGYWKLRATLRNGPVNAPSTMKTYPGGGRLVFWRTTGGAWPQPPPSVLMSSPDQAILVGQKPIPKLVRGEAITLEKLYKGRAIFTARAEAEVVVDGPSGLPETPASNNSQTVNKLVSRQFDVSTGQLQQYLNSLIGQVQIHLNWSDASAKLPRFYDSHWNIADTIIDDVLPEGAAHWAMRDVNYQSATVSMGNEGRLMLTLHFETGGAELDGKQEPGPDNVVPDLNASPITATVGIPLQYNAQYQYFLCGAPQTTVQATMNTVWPAKPSVATDFRNKIKNAVTDMFNHSQVRQKIAYELNRQIKEQAVWDGRIVGVDYNASYIKLHLEVGH